MGEQEDRSPTLLLAIPTPWVDRAIADGDTLGTDERRAYRMRQVPCGHFPPDHPYHNPYGMWRLEDNHA